MTQHPEEGTLHAYIDGELSPAEAATLEQHVAECAACSAALAEARGLVAAASRVITTLDAAPSSAVTPAPAVASVPAATSKRVARPPAFRFPYARAAALLLLVGGTAFVFDRAGTSARGTSAQSESVMADAAAGSDLAATAPVEAATTPTTAPIQIPESTPMGATLSTGAAGGATGNARQESASQRRAVATITDGSARPRAPERSAPPSTTAPAEFVGRGVAGGVATKDARTALATAPPPPARMRSMAQERAVAGALNLVAPVARYRTPDGIVVTLTEEPLRTIFAEESLATQQSESQPVQQRMAAVAVAPVVNSYRWSSAERGKTYTLSGPLTVAELEALSKKLSELERVP